MSAEALLAETEWLRRMASTLVYDGAAAEDLAQDTMLAALRHAPSEVRLRPWLATVARNLAGRRRTREANRTAREVAVARSEHVVDHPIESFTVHQSVVNAVMGLEEPYRGTILLRYWEDLSVREVAKRTGVPIETVRTRLKRGLAKLRARLDHQHGTRSAWIIPFFSIPGVQESTGFAASASTLGGLAMIKKLGLAAAALLLALFVVYLTDPFGALPTDQTLATPDRPAGQQAALAATPLAPRDTPEERGHVDAAQVPETNGLSITVRNADGNPAPGSRIYVRPQDGGLGHALSAATDGTATLSPLPPGRYLLMLDRCSGPEVEVPATGIAHCEVTVPAGAWLEGRVINPAKAPVPFAQVYREAAGHENCAMLLTTADAEGRFRVLGLERNAVVFARAEGWQPSKLSRRLTSYRAGQFQDIELKLGARASKLTGRVVLASGKPAAFALIGVAVDEDARKHIDGLKIIRRSEGGKALDREGFLLRADAAGNFSTSEVVAGEALLLVRSESDPPQVGAQVIDVGRTDNAPVTIQLAAAGHVSGFVRGEDGVPVANARLRWEWRGTNDLGNLEDGLVQQLGMCTATSAADGSFSMDGLMIGRGRIERLMDDRRGERQKILVAAGVTTTVLLTVAPERFLEVSIQRQGQPVVGWAVASFGRDAWRWHKVGRYVTDARGRTRVPARSQRGYRLSLHPPSAARGPEFDFLPAWSGKIGGEERHRSIQLDASDGFRSGAVSGIVTISGTLRGTFVTVRRVRFGGERQCKVAQDGTFEIENLVAGDYEIQVHQRGYVAPMRRARVQTGNSVSLGTVALTKPASVELRVASRAKTRLRRLRVEIANAKTPDDRSPLRSNSSTGIYRSHALPPGHYVLRVRAPGFSTKVLDVTVSAGQTVRKQVQLEPDGS